MKILRSRVFWATIAFGLALGVSVHAAIKSNPPVQSQPIGESGELSVAYKPVCDPVLHPSQSEDDCYYKEPEKLEAPKALATPKINQALITTPKISGICTARSPKSSLSIRMEKLCQEYAVTGKQYTKEEVVQLIHHWADYFQVPVQHPLRIFKCESGYRWDAINNSSTASGVAQFIDRTWLGTYEAKAGVSRFDADANIKAAIRHMSVHGYGAWECK